MLYSDGIEFCEVHWKKNSFIPCKRIVVWLFDHVAWQQRPSYQWEVCMPGDFLVWSASGHSASDCRADSMELAHCGSKNSHPPHPEVKCLGADTLGIIIGIQHHTMQTCVSVYICE